jgi:hypothetical protein
MFGRSFRAAGWRAFDDTIPAARQCGVVSHPRANIDPLAIDLLDFLDVD